MVSADTNLFLYAANPDSPYQTAAIKFFAEAGKGDQEFVLCELVLIEIYMQLRNPAVLKNPLTAKKAANFCTQLRTNPNWQNVDYEAEVSKSVWNWASRTRSGFREIIDARLAFTLLHHAELRTSA